MPSPDEKCPRCGHDVVRSLPLGLRLRRRFQLQAPPRVACGRPTVEGWDCRCASRFHSAVKR